MRLKDWYPLTQYGQTWPLAAKPFKDRPNLEAGETSLSLILGKVDAVAASVLVRTFVAADALRRLTTVRDLRRDGFTVTYSPDEGHRLHVSVAVPPGKDWDDGVATRFSSCFTDVEGIERGN